MEVASGMQDLLALGAVVRPKITRFADQQKGGEEFRGVQKLAAVIVTVRSKTRPAPQTNKCGGHASFALDRITGRTVYIAAKKESAMR